LTRWVICGISATFAEKISIADAIVYKHLLRDGCTTSSFTEKNKRQNQAMNSTAKLVRDMLHMEAIIFELLIDN
jgi:hypothetical protein